MFAKIDNVENIIYFSQIFWHFTPNKYKTHQSSRCCKQSCSKECHVVAGIKTVPKCADYKYCPCSNGGGASLIHTISQPMSCRHIPWINVYFKTCASLKNRNYNLFFMDYLLPWRNVCGRVINVNVDFFSHKEIHKMVPLGLSPPVKAGNVTIWPQQCWSKLNKIWFS